jgi:hypothetical protein
MSAHPEKCRRIVNILEEIGKSRIVAHHHFRASSNGSPDLIVDSGARFAVCDCCGRLGADSGDASENVY